VTTVAIIVVIAIAIGIAADGFCAVYCSIAAMHASLRTSIG